MKATKKHLYASPAAGAVVSVREAKAQFSALVARAATGEEITLSWHGKPRARLVPLQAAGTVFRVDRDWLRSMPVRGHGKRAEELVRAERDSRG
jgi:prevent-host-death family protein